MGRKRDTFSVVVGLFGIAGTVFAGLTYCSTVPPSVSKNSRQRVDTENPIATTNSNNPTTQSVPSTVEGLPTTTSPPESSLNQSGNLSLQQAPPEISSPSETATPTAPKTESSTGQKAAVPSADQRSYNTYDNADADGQPRDDTSALLRVQSTAPILFRCRWPSKGSCFRVNFHISPASGPLAKIGYINSGNGIPMLYQSQASASGGATCQGFPIGGLPYAGLGSRNQVIWWQQPFEITLTNPGSFNAEFRCDGKVGSGDTLTLQVTFAMDGAHGGEIVRYDFATMNVEGAKRG